MSINPRVVCLGGGHGLAATLAAMRTLTNQVTAVVTVADNGGSSGRLRAEFNSLPPGDLRMALAALCGQVEVAAATGKVEELKLIPSKPKATPEALDALQKADWITVGPGSWLSSVMPHFLLSEQAKQIQQSNAKKIMIFNLPDKNTSDEFSGFSLEAHLQLVLNHTPDLSIDVALIDKSLEGLEPKFEKLVAKCGGRVVAFDLADSKETFHHDREKLILAFTHIFK